MEAYGIDDLGLLDEYLNDEKCVAVGEIGLDYHWMESTKEKQKAFFEAQIEIAKNNDLPVIVHDREAHGDTLDILKATKPKGVLHCFSGSKEMAREIIKQTPPQSKNHQIYVPNHGLPPLTEYHIRN